MGLSAGAQVLGGGGAPSTGSIAKIYETIGNLKNTLHVTRREQNGAGSVAENSPDLISGSFTSAGNIM